MTSVPSPATVRAALAQSGLVPVDAQVLLAHALGVNRAWLIAHAADPLPAASAAAFLALAKRRRDGEPVAYLTGIREFWGLPLAVTPAVLIPRPETETLVELALARLPPDRPVSVLDLGTGSGAVALAIARERPRARVVATDVSPDALAVARDNARRLGIANVAFLRSDWYEALPAESRFDAVVSNPPYVRAGDPHLGEGDLRFEPAAALSPGGDGWARCGSSSRARGNGSFREARSRSSTATTSRRRCRRCSPPPASTPSPSRATSPASPGSSPAGRPEDISSRRGARVAVDRAPVRHRRVGGHGPRVPPATAARWLDHPTRPHAAASCAPRCGVASAIGGMDRGAGAWLKRSARQRLRR